MVKSRGRSLVPARASASVARSPRSTGSATCAARGLGAPHSRRRARARARGRRRRRGGGSRRTRRSRGRTPRRSSSGGGPWRGAGGTRRGARPRGRTPGRRGGGRVPAPEPPASVARRSIRLAPDERSSRGAPRRGATSKHPRAAPARADVVPSPASTSCDLESSTSIFAVGWPTSIVDNIVAPSFVMSTSPSPFWIILSMPRGPRDVRMASAMAFAAMMLLRRTSFSFFSPRCDSPSIARPLIFAGAVGGVAGVPREHRPARGGVCARARGCVRVVAWCGGDLGLRVADGARPTLASSPVRRTSGEFTRSERLWRVHP